MVRRRNTGARLGRLVGRNAGSAAGGAIGGYIGGAAGASAGSQLGGSLGKKFGGTIGHITGKKVNQAYDKQKNTDEFKQVAKATEPARTALAPVMKESRATAKEVIGSFKKGGSVKRTGHYLLHKGEYVVPNQKKGKRRHVIIIK